MYSNNVLNKSLISKNINKADIFYYIYHLEGNFWRQYSKIKCEYGDSDDKQDGLNFCEFSWKRAHPGLFNRACATMILET